MEDLPFKMLQDNFMQTWLDTETAFAQFAERYGSMPMESSPKGLVLARLAATALMPSSNPKDSPELKIQGAFF